MHWHAWNDAALNRAREENKPILVSIGYATCHWCHVMERESFENEATAQMMNDRFVCIKVDREERPDVDSIYMEACQAINGSGGWPLNAFLLPDGRPYYAGTYYPPTAKYNRPSWKDVLLSLSNSYHDNHDQVVEQAERLTQSIAKGGRQILQIEPEAEDHAEWRASTLEKLVANYDHQNGGFGGAPKFPMSQALEALLLHGARYEDQKQIDLVEHAALAMLDGGIYDQLGGGFSRYTVDAGWRVPHFEKMLYDNALLLRLLAKLQMARPDPRYPVAIAETTAWLQREMRLPSGGYRAGLDADSEGVEGKYYVWQTDEVDRLLDDNQARLIKDFYGLTEPGNWKEERTNIPFRPGTLAETAKRLGLPTDVAAAQLDAAKKILHDHRFKSRIHPGEDNKIILQWNALLVSAWTWCYRATGENDYLSLATDLYQSLERQLHTEGQWHRNITAGKAGADAFLPDLAAVCEAQLDLYAVTFDPNFLGLPDRKTEGADAGAGKVGKGHDRTGASDTLRRILVGFPTEKGPMFNLSRNGKSKLPVTTVELFDNALPSGNAQTMRCLLRLGRLLDDAKLTERGEEMLAAMAGGLQRYPTSFGNWLHAGLEHAVADRELVVVGPGAVEAARPLLSGYRPGLLIVASETENEDLPLLKNRYLPDGLQFYPCQNQACHLPVSTAAEAMARIDLAN